MASNTGSTYFSSGLKPMALAKIPEFGDRDVVVVM